MLVMWPSSTVTMGFSTITSPLSRRAAVMMLFMPTPTLEPVLNFGAAALRPKTGPDEAEAEGFGYSKVEADNEIWPGFRRNPQGRGGFFPIALSLVVQIHPVFLSPRFAHSEKSPPVAACSKVENRV